MGTTSHQLGRKAYLKRRNILKEDNPFIGNDVEKMAAVSSARPGFVDSTFSLVQPLSNCLIGV